MGVTGLWRLIEPAGKPVPVETLENKVLAVDISIWLHQMVKGYQDAKGAPLPNSHLIGLFQRLCKLLYFRIKPVFVFDGAYPDLKKETIAKRQDHKSRYNSESERLKRELALLLRKKTAVSSLLGKQISPKKGSTLTDVEDDLFKLPALPEREESESESEDEQNSSSGSIVDLHTMDLQSEKFKNLPAKEKYDLLIELKETRKMNSWGRLHELPKQSDNFSEFQMQRLLKRRKVQECLEETEKEMGHSGMSLNDLEALLNEEGIDTKVETLPSRRIASNNTTRFLLINDVKKALAEAKKREEATNKPSTSTNEETASIDIVKSPIKDELEDDLQKAIKMSLECADADTSIGTSKTDESWTSCLTDSDSNDSEDDCGDGFEQPDMSSAKAYIMQYSDYTNQAIDKIINKKVSGPKNKTKFPKLNEILDEIDKEKSVVVDKVDLSSSDDDCIGEDVIETGDIKNNQCIVDEVIDDKMDSTQASVVCIENTVPDIISLDSSTEEIMNVTENKASCNQIRPDDSDSSNDEFEDVPEMETKTEKPVVQLTLNIGDAPDDDIFADIFEDSKKSIKQIIPEPKLELAFMSSESILVDDKPIPKEEKILKNKTLHDSVIEIDDSPLKNNSAIIDRDNIVIESTTESISRSKMDTDQTNLNKIMNDEPNTLELFTTQESPKKAANEDTTTVPTLITNKTIPAKDDQTANNMDISAHPPKEVMTTEKLNTLAEDLETQEQGLLQEKGRMDRVGRNITEQMTKEAQDLLQIFGIPYIVAPMEAEAQCAFLENAKLTDGTITDDSDIWLFGGRTVYKNFFNQKKHVLQFLADRIEKSFNLSREQLVLLALLVGSDYTTGVNGVGPVTALEILASFPFNKKQLQNETSKQARYTQIVTGLQEFKRWVRAGKRTDNNTLKKKLKNVDITDDFPSIRVVQAYLEPNIDKNEDKFSWGDLDITILRDYTKAKFGWSQNKLDEIIKPVLKRMQDRKSQKTVEDYFKKKVEILSLEHQLSKRVKAAVQRMDPERLLEDQVEKQDNVEKNKKAIKHKGVEKPVKGTKAPKAGPSGAKRKKTDEQAVINQQCVKVVSQIEDGKSVIDIQIPKTDRYQEIIPQREKHKQILLQNKLKAIEIFRKTKIDPKKKASKRKPLQPKKKADLSESDSD